MYAKLMVLHKYFIEEFTFLLVIVKYANVVSVTLESQRKIQRERERYFKNRHKERGKEREQ